MKVVVARPIAQAERTARRLAGAGYAPIIAPLMRTTPRPAPATTGVRYAALAATSANAFACFADVGLPHALRNVPLFAVGERTGDAARRSGARRTIDGAGAAHDLAARIASALPRGARVLYLAGAVRKPDLEHALAAAGIAVDIVVTYGVEPVDCLPPPLADLLRTGGRAAMLHYSARGAAVAVALARADRLIEPFLAWAHRAISPAAGGPLAAAGARDVAFADRPVEDALFATLPPRR